MELQVLKVIVTGAARGMGAHFARRLAEAGAQVAAGDVDEASLAALPRSVHRRRLDVSDEADVAAFVAWAAGAMGGLNALVNNAGILRDALVAAIPVGRIGAPEDIWCAVRFIVECDDFNGRCVDVDGGLVM